MGCGTEAGEGEGVEHSYILTWGKNSRFWENLARDLLGGGGEYTKDNDWLIRDDKKNK